MMRSEFQYQNRVYCRLGSLNPYHISSFKFIVDLAVTFYSGLSKNRFVPVANCLSELIFVQYIQCFVTCIFYNDYRWFILMTILRNVYM